MSFLEPAAKYDRAAIDFTMQMIACAMHCGGQMNRPAIVKNFHILEMTLILHQEGKSCLIYANKKYE